jgi:hypothetical protein
MWDLERAITANEIALIGDIQVGTKFPLRFRVAADEKFNRTVGSDGEVRSPA